MPTRAQLPAFASVMLLVVAVVGAAQDPPYAAIEGWLRLPAGMQLGAVTAASADADGNVYVFQRREPPVLKLDRSGSFLRSLGDDLVTAAHGLRVDRQGSVWVTDVRGHVVYKFDREGRLLLTLGKKGVAGDGTDTFNGPTDVLLTERGDIFIADGQFNSRVTRFSADGRFISSFGTNGTEPGQFKVPHALAMDSRGRLFVADRDNGRIQIFDQDGTFLEQWTQFGAPSGVFITSDDTLYVAAIGARSGVLIGSARTGEVGDFIPVLADGVNGPHLLSVDAKGTIYLADLLASDLRIFLKKN